MLIKHKIFPLIFFQFYDAKPHIFYNCNKYDVIPTTNIILINPPFTRLPYKRIEIVKVYAPKNK